MKSIKEELLTSPIYSLELSAPCKAFLQQLDIASLKEFIEIGWKAHFEHPQFDPRLFNEVIGILERNRLLYLMEGK